MLLQKKALILSTENDMQRGHYDVEQRHKTAIKQLQYRYKKNFGRCNNLTMRLWANSGSSPVRTAYEKKTEIRKSKTISSKSVTLGIFFCYTTTDEYPVGSRKLDKLEKPRDFGQKGQSRVAFPLSF